MTKTHLKIAISNHTPEMIDDMTVEDLAAMKATVIRSLQDQLAEQRATLNRRSVVLQLACMRKFGDKAAEVLHAARKDSGTVHVVDDEIDVACKRDKDIKWDQTLLRVALDQLAALDPELARHYAKIELSVGEAVYKTAPPYVVKILQTARTVTPKKMTFEFKDVKR